MIFRTGLLISAGEEFLNRSLIFVGTVLLFVPFGTPCLWSFIALILLLLDL